MEKTLSILLIEDDQDTCSEFEQCIEKFEDLVLVGITDNSYEGITYVKGYLPNVVILDLELHLGGGSGLLFLQDLKNLDIAVSPFILVTTNNSSQLTYDYVRQLGADFIMAKHQADYTPMAAIELLRMMKDIIVTKSLGKVSRHSTTETPVQQSQRIRRLICLELDLVGINPKMIGYKYLTDAIQLIIDAPGKRVSAIIGEKYGKTENSVDRAMRHVINNAWHTTDIEDLLTHYTAKINSDRGVPTVSEFIFYYAHKVKNRY